MTFAKSTLATIVLLALAACAKGPPQDPPPARSPAAAPSFVAQPALDRWVTALRTENPECKVDVRVLVADEAQMTLEPMHPRATADEPPRQIPTVHYVFVLPFVDDAEVTAKRDAQKLRVDACVADAGPGAQHKGRDMNREACVITSAEGPAIPSAHLERELSVYVPAYFSPPSECANAAAAMERLTPYR